MPADPPPNPAAGATMTGSVIGGIGRSSAAAPTPGKTSIADGSEAGGNCMSGASGRPDGTSTAPPPPPPPPGAGRPTPLVEVDVAVSLDVVVLVGVVSLDVVRLLVVCDGVVFVDDSVVDFVVGGELLPPQPCALPLLPVLP